MSNDPVGQEMKGTDGITEQEGERTTRRVAGEEGECAAFVVAEGGWVQRRSGIAGWEVSKPRGNGLVEIRQDAEVMRRAKCSGKKTKGYKEQTAVCGLENERGGPRTGKRGKWKPVDNLNLDLRISPERGERMSFGAGRLCNSA